MAQVQALARVLGLEMSDLVEDSDAVHRLAPQREIGANVTDLGDGRARLRVDVDTSWAVALEVLRLLKIDEGAPSQGTQGQGAPCQDTSGHDAHARPEDEASA